MSSASRRSVSPAVAMVREFLLGRQWNGQLRYPDAIATRSPPPPNLPPGPACKLSDNYYYTRDARREVGPPKLIVDGTVPLKQIPDSSKGAAKIPTPGVTYLP